jgi:von Willebrand factor type A domain
MTEAIPTPIEPKVVESEIHDDSDFSRLNAIAMKEVRKLAKKMGPWVASLPIYIDPVKSKYRAYTTSEAIYLEADFIRNDPDSVQVAIAHEIFHHVVRSNETRGFPNELVNAGEDFVINLAIKDLFGLDVKASKGGGLMDEAYRGLRPKQVCEALANGEEIPTGCGCPAIACRPLLAGAESIRRLLMPDYRQPLLFATDADDNHAFDRQLDIVRHDVDFGAVPVSPISALNGMFHRTYQYNPHPTPLTRKTLSADEAVAYCFKSELVMERTTDDAPAAMYAAMIYMNNLRNHANFLKYRVAIAKDKNATAQAELATIVNKRAAGERRGVSLPVLKKAQEKADRTASLLRNAERKVPIENLLESHPVQLKSAKEQVMRNTPISIRQMRRNALDDSKFVLPTIKPNITTRTLALISRQGESHINYVMFFERQLNDHFGGEGQEDEDAVVPTETIDDDEVDGNPTDDDEVDGNPTDDATETPEDVEVVTVQVDEEGNVSADRPTKNSKPVESGGGLGGNNGKKGDTAGTMTRYDRLKRVGEVTRTQHLIFAAFQEIRTALISKTRRRADENQLGVDTMLALGDDLQRVDVNELAMLFRKETEMLFMTRLAESALLMRVVPESRRSPVIIGVDCSGSMSGEPYIKACGFALAMLEKLILEGRGVALFLFSTRVEATLEVKEGGKATSDDVLKFLSDCNHGGTSFEAAVEGAFDIKDRMNWQHATAFFVTDGKAMIRNTETLMRRKTRDDKFTALLTGRTATPVGFANIINSYTHIEKGGVLGKLIEMGNLIL